MTKRGFRRVFKVAGLVLISLAAITVIVALAIQFKINLANDWQQYEKLPPAAEPVRNDSILVISPHPDDETLGCGGLLASAVRNGARTHVVFMTNGDGYKLAVGTSFKSVRVTPAMCIEFAYSRQKETLAALHTLGVRSGDATFLGYPDRGLAQLWNRFWEPTTLYTSSSTKTDHSPYENSLTPGALYCGESVVKDIQRVLRQQEPTDVYIPHPYDNHPDHYATYCFASAAIAQLKAEGWRFAQHIRVHTYLVHRGDWPTPKGEHLSEPLAPPYALAQSGTKWYSLQLTPDLVREKRAAIRKYRSQVSLEPGFMKSFARSTELFGDLPVRRVVRVPNGSVSVDGGAEEWVRVPPAVIDPVGDYVVAGMNKGGDVRTIYMCADADYLYVRIDCAGRLSRRISYTLNFRGVSDSNHNDHYSVSIKPPDKCSRQHTLWSYRNNMLEIALPRRDFSFDEDIFVQVETRTMRLLVDNTGWQGVEFSRKPARVVVRITRV